MKIRMLDRITDEVRQYELGEVVECSAAKAEYFVKSGYGEVVPEPEPVAPPASSLETPILETATMESGDEQAVMPKPNRRRGMNG